VCGRVLQLQFQRSAAFAELVDDPLVHAVFLGTRHDSVVGFDGLGLQRDHPLQHGEEADVPARRGWLTLDGGGVEGGVEGGLRHREEGCSLGG
jgi:hypothetical protein